MIKIAFIRNVSPINFGGIKKHCNELYTLFENDEDILILPIEDIPTLYLPIIKKTIFKFSKLYNYIKTNKCDIVHIHGFASLDVIQAFIVAKILGKKIIYSPHYHPFKYLRHPLLAKIFFYGCLRFLLKFANVIITITNNDTIFFQKFHKNVRAIPHYFEPLVDKQNNIEKQKNMILFIGRNDENKGISHLYHLSSKYEVHVVTKGKLERSDFIVHSDISNEELSLLYAKASLVVIPSRYEAFSYVALEAFAHNTPVVMSDTVMIADYLKECKGYKTFKYGNVEDFLKKVDETIGQSVDAEKIISIFQKGKIKKYYKETFKIIFNS